MAGSHIELRKRNEKFAKRIGTTNKLKSTDPLDKKRPIPPWALYMLIFVVLGGIFFEIAQQLFAYFYPVEPKLRP